MSDATRTTGMPEQKAEPLRGRPPAAHQPPPAGPLAPDRCEITDELAAVAVLSTN